MDGDSFNQTGVSEGSAMPPRQSPELRKESGGGKGALIGAIIVIILLIAAGFYLWKTQSLSPQESDTSIGNAMNLETDIGNLPDPSLEALVIQASDDSILSIEADVEGTNLLNIDEEINVIEGELQGL